MKNESHNIFRTGLQLGTPPHSSISTHTVNTCGALPTHSSFKILLFNPNPISRDIRILESIFISRNKPELII